MDISKPQLVTAMALIALASTLALAQENAIGGQVRLRGSDKPLGQVRIKVAQKADVHDTTDDKDGVYVLSIPKTLKKFDLIYEHDNCFRVADEGILNEQAQNKRPVRELRPKSIAAVRTLTPKELNEIAEQSFEMIFHAAENNTPALFEAGQSNLLVLSAAAETIGNEAQAEAEKGQLAKAEEGYKTSLAILEKVRPASYQLAEILDEYASLLRKTGRPALADHQAAKANEARLQAQFFDKAMPTPFRAYGDEWMAYNRRLHEPIGNWSRNDKFALDHIHSLPNLEGTITLLSDTNGQFGRVSVPGKGSASFRIHVEGRRVPVLRILRGTTGQFEVEVTGAKGRVELRKWSNLVTWDPGTSKTFTITIENKDPQKRDYVVNLSAWSSSTSAEP